MSRIRIVTDLPEEDVSYITESMLKTNYPAVSELKTELNNMKGLTAESFCKAVRKIERMSKDDLIMLFSSDRTIGDRANVENEILRGIIRDSLYAKNVDVSQITPKHIVSSKELIIIDDTEIPVYVVSPDKTIRAREPYSLVGEPVPGRYHRHLQKKPTDLECCVSQVLFTDRLGMPIFVSSFNITFYDSAFQDHGIATQTLTVSEKSFRTSISHWKRLFSEMLTLSKSFGLDAICLRKHFETSFLSSIIENVSDEIPSSVYPHLPPRAVPEALIEAAHAQDDCGIVNLQDVAGLLQCGDYA